MFCPVCGKKFKYLKLSPDLGSSFLRFGFNCPNCGSRLKIENMDEVRKFFNFYGIIGLTIAAILPIVFEYFKINQYKEIFIIFGFLFFGGCIFLFRIEKKIKLFPAVSDIIFENKIKRLHQITAMIAVIIAIITVIVLLGHYL